MDQTCYKYKHLDTGQRTILYSATSRTLSSMQEYQFRPLALEGRPPPFPEWKGVIAQGHGYSRGLRVPGEQVGPREYSYSHLYRGAPGNSGCGR